MAQRPVYYFAEGEAPTLESQTTVEVPDAEVNIDLLRTRLQQYLGLSNPTANQNMKALRGLIRLALYLTDDISDTV